MHSFCSEWGLTNFFVKFLKLVYFRGPLKIEINKNVMHNYTDITLVLASRSLNLHIWEQQLLHYTTHPFPATNLKVFSLWGERTRNQSSSFFFFFFFRNQRNQPLWPQLVGQQPVLAGLGKTTRNVLHFKVFVNFEADYKSFYMYVIHAFYTI